MQRSTLSRVSAPAFVAAAFLSITPLAQAVLSYGDASPTKSNAATDFIPGTGIPENQFTIDTAGTGEKVAIKARDRATGVPLDVAGNRYYVSAGNDPFNASRAAWNFDFQFTPIAGKVPSDYTYEVQADIDPGFGVTNFVTIAVPDSVQAVPVGDSYYPNGSGGSISAGPTYSYTAGWSDATPFVIANSQNYKFSFLAGSGFTNADPGEYELRLTMRNAVGGATVATVTAFAHVPEPASLSMLGVAGLAALRRSRRAN